MSDRELLIVRELPATGIPGERREALAAVPAAPAGFIRRGELSALAVYRDKDLVWLAPFARAELRAFGRILARAVLIGIPDDHLDGLGESSREACYRQLLDFLASGPRSPHVVVIEVGDRDEAHVDLLWRLALAANMRLTTRDAGDRIRLELFAPGRGGDLASLVATRPHALARAALRGVRGAMGTSQGEEKQTLAVFALDVEETIPLVSPRAAVEFTELPADIVRRRPRRFGIGLVAAARDLGDRHQIVGRIGDRIVFQLGCHRSAPALGLLSAPQRSQLVGPVALITEARTEPEFRNRSIFAAGLQWTAQWARRQGIRTLVLLILVDNMPSLRGAARAGFRRLGEVTTLR